MNVQSVSLLSYFQLAASPRSFPVVGTIIPFWMEHFVVQLTDGSYAELTNDCPIGMNLGYKRMDPSHPCKRCWSKYANPSKDPSSPPTPTNSPANLYPRSNALFPPLILHSALLPLHPALDLSPQLPQPRTSLRPGIPISRSGHCRRTGRLHPAMLWCIVRAIRASVAGFVGVAMGRAVSVCFCLIARHVLSVEVWGGSLDSGRRDTFSFLFPGLLPII